MSKRFQVFVDERELRAIRAVARREHKTVAEWVRQVLRDACRRRATGDADRKLSAIRRAAKGSFTTADIDQMLAEIERGCGARAGD